MAIADAARAWVLGLLGGSENEIRHPFTWATLPPGVSVQAVRDAAKALVESGVIGSGSGVVDTDNASYILRIVPWWTASASRSWIMQKCYDQYMLNSQSCMKFTAVPGDEPEPPIVVIIRESHALEALRYVKVLGEARDVIHVSLEPEGRFYWEEQLARLREEPRKPVGFDQEAA